MRVALVTVGDELLVGETVNTNASWLGRRLQERGVSVCRVVVLPDDVADIAQVVNELRAAFDGVIVTGGLGPTHDDVTMDGVAAAFGRDLVESPAVLDWLADERDYAATDLAAGTAEIPRGARFLKNPVGVAPGCVIDSVYVLPGVPEEMQAMFETIAPEFEGEPEYVERVEIDEPESALIDRIAELRREFDVTVGSYPGECVTITIRASDTERASTAAEWLRERVETPE